MEHRLDGGRPELSLGIPSDLQLPTLGISADMQGWPDPNLRLSVAESSSLVTPARRDNCLA